MLLVSLAQVRRHAVRLVATVLAIVIAVGFVVATLVLNQTSKSTVYGAVAAPYKHVTAVVLPQKNAEQALADHQNLLPEIAHVPGVYAAVADRTTYLEARFPGNVGYRGATLNNSTPNIALTWQKLSSGTLPTKDGEVAVGAHDGVGVGDRIALRIYPPDGGAAKLVDATVTGIVDLKGAATLAGSDQLYATDHQAQAWGAQEIDAIRVAGTTSVSGADLRARITSALSTDHQRELQVVSGEQAASEKAAFYTGESSGLTGVLLVFAAVAVLVCALVIANTYAVLLAQRVRELALLRCVGATGRQLLRGVLIESLVTGVTASALGVLAGIGLAGVVSAITAHLNSPIPLSGLSVPLTAVGAGLGLGILVTVLSSLVPALRATTRIAPLAALRPMEAAPLRSARGLLRRVAGFLLLVPGVLALLLGAHAHVLAVAVLGGAVSFVAALLLARWVVPAAVSVAGRTIRNTGVPGKLAALNSVRNPQRTASTATALIIGVTLTTTMVVGAASTRVTANHGLDKAFPTDVIVHGGGDSANGSLPGSLAATLAGLPHVAGAVALPSADVKGPGGSDQDVLGVDRSTVDRAVRSDVGAGVPAAGTVTTPKSLGWGKEGQLVKLTSGRRSIELRVHLVPDDTPASMNASDLARLAPGAVTRTIWLKLSDDLSSHTQSNVLDSINNAAAAAAPQSFVEGSALERNAFNQVITTLLLIVTGLLGVAVVIAIIGVGNTLALSVVERQQESGLLRALGLTRSQLRWMLLWEAVLIAGVAAVLGVAMGCAYGALGTEAVLGLEGPVTVVVPWAQVAAIVVVATAAGAIASVLPARRAARTSPVVAIAG